MLQIVPQMRIFAACNPVDFRCGIDRLAAQCRTIHNEDPFSGALFLFRNKSRTAIKILTYDGGGFWLCHRRLSTGRLKWWPGEGNEFLAARELQVLLWNGDPKKVSFGKDWRRIPQSPGNCSW